MAGKAAVIRRRLSEGPGSFAEQRLLQKRIANALRARGHSKFVCNETAFHMADWLRDLIDLNDLFRGHSRWTSERVERVLFQFLAHVPDHVAAASKVLCDRPVSDLFEVGSIEGSTPVRTAKHPGYSDYRYKRKSRSKG